MKGFENTEDIFNAWMGNMIRQMNENEIDECVELITASFMTVADEFGFNKDNAPRFTAFATTPERLKYQMDVEKRPMYVYVASDEKIVGYYSLALLEEDICELNNLCVLPEYRHQRIGEELLSDAFQKAGELGCRKMKIGIVEENKVLRKWYEKNRFIHTGTEKYDFFPFTCGYMETDL